MNVVVFSSNPHPDWLNKIIETLRFKAFRIVVCSYGHSKVNREAVLSYLLQKSPDAIIINTDCGDDDLYQRLNKMTSEMLSKKTAKETDYLPQAFRLVSCLGSLDLLTKSAPAVICIGGQMDIRVSSILDAHELLLPTDVKLLDPVSLIQKVILNKKRAVKAVAELYANDGEEVVPLLDINQVIDYDDDDDDW